MAKNIDDLKFIQTHINNLGYLYELNIEENNVEKDLENDLSRQYQFLKDKAKMNYKWKKNISLHLTQPKILATLLFETTFLPRSLRLKIPYSPIFLTLMKL